MRFDPESPGDHLIVALARYRFCNGRSPTTWLASLLWTIGFEVFDLPSGAVRRTIDLTLEEAKLLRRLGWAVTVMKVIGRCGEGVQGTGTGAP